MADPYKGAVWIHGVYVVIWKHTSRDGPEFIDTVLELLKIFISFELLTIVTYDIVMVAMVL